MTTQSAATVASRSAATWLALAWARARTTSPGEVSGPSAAITASSSTPETTTSGSTPACRSTVSRPGEADPSTMLVMRHSSIPAPPASSSCRGGSCGSSPHVEPFQQGDLLPAEGRVAKFVDGQAPAGLLLLRGLTSAAGGAAENRDQRGQLLVGRVALEHLDVRPVRVRRFGRRSLRLFFAARGRIVRATPVAYCVRSARSTHSGMFPCFFGGI